MRDAERLELGKMVAETTGLRRAAARARNVVPAGRQFDARNSGARINIEDRATAQDRNVEGAAAGCQQREIGQCATGQMARGTVVPRHREVARKNVRTVLTGCFSPTAPFSGSSVRNKFHQRTVGI